MPKLKKLLDTPTHLIEVPANAVINPQHYLSVISTQAFFRRLTASERASLRGQDHAVRDMKEDLDRGNTVELDQVVRDMLVDSGLFTPARIDELMVLGEAHEDRGR